MKNEILKDEYMKKAGLALLIILSVFFVFKTLAEIKAYKFIGAGVYPSNTISVSGEGEVNAVPDLATFTFTVTEEAKVVKNAQASVSETTDKIFSALKDVDIKEKDIRTLNYNIYPKYEYIRDAIICPSGFDCSPPSGTRTLTGYEVSQSVEVRVRDIDNAGKILSLLGDLNVNNLYGPSFSIDDEDDLKAEAREMAIKSAREKAERLADDLGVKLGRVVSFNEDGFGRVYYDQAYESTVDGKGGDIGVPQPTLPPGENTIRSNVNITYEIR